MARLRAIWRGHKRLIHCILTSFPQAFLPGGFRLTYYVSATCTHTLFPPVTKCRRSSNTLSQVQQQMSQVPKMEGDLRRYMRCMASLRCRSRQKFRTCDAGGTTCDVFRPDLRREGNARNAKTSFFCVTPVKGWAVARGCRMAVMPGGTGTKERSMSLPPPGKKKGASYSSLSPFSLYISFCKTVNSVTSSSSSFTL